MTAPQYVVTNGTAYMAQCSGKRTCTKEYAYRWKTKEAAERQANQRNQGESTSVWHVEETSGVTMVQAFDASELAINTMPEFADMMDSIRGCIESMGRIQQLKERCLNEAKLQDQMQEDLLHKIEFESGGRGTGAHLCVLLRECRKKRRGYKDMLTVLQAVGETCVAEVNETQLNYVCNKLNNRLYRTRTEEVF